MINPAAQGALMALSVVDGINQRYAVLLKETSKRIRRASSVWRCGMKCPSSVGVPKNLPYLYEFTDFRMLLAIINAISAAWYERGIAAP